MKKRGTIIGISGLAGAGKSTFADLLAEQLSAETQAWTPKIAFADPMRAMMIAAFGEEVRAAVEGPSEMRR